MVANRGARYSEHVIQRQCRGLQEKINFSLIKSIDMCFRGVRSVSRPRAPEQDTLFCPSVSEHLSKILI